jgi:hypothetical protein
MWATTQNWQNDSTPLVTTGGVSVRIVALLAVASFINYVDRGSLATAAPLVRDEFALSSTQLGLLLSAFFWSYRRGRSLPAGSQSGSMRVACSPAASPSGAPPLHSQAWQPAL